MHSFSDVPPVVARYVPIGHLAHDADPTVSLYLPATHDVHEPGVPVKPRSQEHSKEYMAPADGVVEFGGHDVHVSCDVAPVAAEYVPAGLRCTT